MLEKDKKGILGQSHNGNLFENVKMQFKLYNDY